MPPCALNCHVCGRWFELLFEAKPQRLDAQTQAGDLLRACRALTRLSCFFVTPQIWLDGPRKQLMFPRTFEFVTEAGTQTVELFGDLVEMMEARQKHAILSELRTTARDTDGKVLKRLPSKTSQASMMVTPAALMLTSAERRRDCDATAPDVQRVGRGCTWSSCLVPLRMSALRTPAVRAPPERTSPTLHAGSVDSNDEILQEARRTTPQTKPQMLSAHVVPWLPCRGAL